MYPTPHTFHIPVMGTGFTLDTPLHVARYGISSVISLVDDTLIEQVRKYYCGLYGEPYEEIPLKSEDHRARRITAYLNLLDRLIASQVEELKASDFSPGSEITRYFELLPDGEPRDSYHAMLRLPEGAEKQAAQDRLRGLVVPGTIDVNIMTKLDAHAFIKGEKVDSEMTDAMSALRGYANSTVRSSIVFSAGMHSPLYAYLAQFEDFFPDADGVLKKRITLKVSDYRSAMIQGKFFAKRGLWVSEYRVESGLNCGGHAFATDGYLLGPILEEFRDNREALSARLSEAYLKNLAKLGKDASKVKADIAVTVQGGIGTNEENQFLLEYYKLDRTGWGTPFLLVPEIVGVCDEDLEKLAATGSDNVYLSPASPMGVPFWNIRNSSSELAREKRIAEGKPGAACIKSFLRFDTEFGEIPICRAAREYVTKKLEQIANSNMPEKLRKFAESEVYAKSCICNELGGSLLRKLGISESVPSAICPGENIVNFNRTFSLEEMIGHIYGRISLLSSGERPHMMITELRLYVEYLRDEVERLSDEVSDKTADYCELFKRNLLDGIGYYQKMAENYFEKQHAGFLADLDRLRGELETITPVAVN